MAGDDGILVMKFGGTSMAGAERMRGVAAIVAAARSRRILIVVSAMSRVTDALLDACGHAASGDQGGVRTAIDAIEARHLETVTQLASQTTLDAEALSGQIRAECASLRTVLTSVAVLQEITPRGLDRVAAAGELMSSRILAALLEAFGLPARWIDPRRALVTTDAFGSAAPMRAYEEAVRREIVPALEAGAVAVTGGFVGATTGGITTTLGRGGSDYSAALFGTALGAREIQIWTDVDGMLTADPRIVPDAQPVERLSFDEASELAYFGAKVLHPSTILPAIGCGIPVRILNTMRPTAPGSLITAASKPDGRPLAAIACKRDITVVNVTSTRMLLAHGFLRRVFEIFERHATSVDVVTTSEVSVSMTLDDDRRIDAIEADLSGFASVQVERGMAIVSAVGDNLRSDPSMVVSVIAALGRLPLRMVSQAAGRRNVTVVLSDADVPTAMARLHEEFFATAAVAG
jgi:aspartate kinase